MNASRAGLRFQCTGCGRCCFGGDDHYVRVTQAERQRIRRHLDVSEHWLRRRYLTRLEDGNGYGIALRDGRCVFLGADLRCRVYAVRPEQCRTYPFWPEVVVSQRAWRAEAKRCEGIGRGDVVPLERVTRLLHRQRKAEQGGA